MRYLVLFVLFLCNQAKTQTVLKFDKRFVESEDKWVAFQADKDDSHLFGFIYIDEQAGLTFDHAGTFKIFPDGTFLATKKDSFSMKTRLSPNNTLVAFIPQTKFKELQISKYPDWLKFYKNDTNSVKHLYRWGFLYNGWNECEKALTYLERAYKEEPGYKDLEVELAFSYNCLKQYDKALKVLQNALKINPCAAYVNKEFIYAQILAGKLTEAEESFRSTVRLCPDTTYFWESAYNILHTWYERKDKLNFMKWLPEANRWAAKNERVQKNIKLMEKSFSE